MLDDFVLIKDKFYGVPQLNIYPLGDAHIGSNSRIRRLCYTK